MNRSMHEKIERLFAAMREGSRNQDSPTSPDYSKSEDSKSFVVTVYDFSHASVCLIMGNDGANKTSNR